MTVWVLIVWMGTANVHTLGAYKTEAECREYGQTYKHIHCVKVDVPRPTK